MAPAPPPFATAVFDSSGTIGSVGSVKDKLDNASALLYHSRVSATTGDITFVAQTASGGAFFATATAATLTPVAGAGNTITLTVKNTSGATDTTYTGAHNVTVSGFSAAPNGSYGSFNGVTLTGSPQTISVTFTDGVATPSLVLNNAATQNIGFSLPDLTYPDTAPLTITPTASSFRSVASGNWNNTATWEYYNGSTWVATAFTPTSSDGTITIRTNHTVTVTANVTNDQVVVQSGGQITVSDTIGLTLNNGDGNDLEVNSGGTVAVEGVGKVDGAGSFVLDSGATLQIGSPDGITSSGATGSIQTGTRIFTNAANYTYNGIVAQVTGNGLPSAVNNLNITSSAGVSLSQNVTASAVTVTSGTLNMNAQTLTGPVSVGAGAILHGNGTIYGPLIVSGTVDPGASPGTITVTSNVTFNANSTNHVDISGADSDVIDLSGLGSLTISNGAILDLGTLEANNVYVIFRRINGAISGTFKDTSGNVLENNSQLHLQSGWYIHYVNSGTNGYIVLNQTPTAVVLLQLQALTQNGQVTVRWSTSSESKTAGFDLYRLTDGVWVKLNAALIPSQGWPNGGIGASYSVADPTAQPGQTYTYKLVERTTDGQSIEYGPFERTVSEFAVKNFEMTPEGFKLRWLSRAGEKYRVLKCTDLRTGQYLPIAENLDATPPENEYVDPVTTGAAFYRIELQP